MRCNICQKQWTVSEDKGLGNCPSCGADTLMMLNNQILNPPVNTILHNIILVFGEEILNDKQRISTIINDLFKNDDRVRRLLQLSIQHEVPSQIARLFKSKSYNLLTQLSSLKDDTQNISFLKEDAINDIFLYWELALNPPVLLSTKVNPEDGEWIDNYGVKYSKDKQKLIKGANIQDYEIIYGTKVICDKAFFHCYSLKNIFIPNSVNAIGRSAFLSCDGLTHINIPPSVKSIGEHAFNSSGLESVSLPVSLSVIEANSFHECKALNSITIPDSIVSIDEGAFYKCDKLKNITLPNSVSSIGNFAFLGCKSLTNVVISDSVISIGDRTFLGCKLTSISLSKSVSSLGTEVFPRGSQFINIEVDISNKHFCSIDGILFDKNVNRLICHPAGKINLERSYSIPDAVISIVDFAFADCDWLTSIDLPNSLKSIGEYAFFFCSGLTSIYIPNSVTSIGKEAFGYCENLRRIYLPDSITSIGNQIFAGCDNLNEILINSNNVFLIERLSSGYYSKIVLI